MGQRQDQEGSLGLGSLMDGPIFPLQGPPNPPLHTCSFSVPGAQTALPPEAEAVGRGTRDWRAFLVCACFVSPRGLKASQHPGPDSKRHFLCDKSLPHFCRVTEAQRGLRAGKWGARIRTLTFASQDHSSTRNCEQ